MGISDLGVGGREWSPYFPLKLQRSRQSYSSLGTMTPKNDATVVVAITHVLGPHHGPAWLGGLDLCHSLIFQMYFTAEGPEAQSGSGT